MLLRIVVSRCGLSWLPVAVSYRGACTRTLSTRDVRVVHGSVLTLPPPPRVQHAILQNPNPYVQFVNNGCENCQFLQMESDQARVQDCTTTYFTG